MKFRAGDTIRLNGGTLGVLKADFSNPNLPIYTVAEPTGETWTTYAIGAELVTHPMFEAGDRILIPSTNRVVEVLAVEFEGFEVSYVIRTPDGTTGRTSARDATLVSEDKPEDEMDDVKHPNHYQIRHTEVFEFIDDIVSCIPDGPNALRAAVALGNVAKYVLRSPYKGSFLKDLRKAHVYLTRFVELTEGAE